MMSRPNPVWLLNPWPRGNCRSAALRSSVRGFLALVIGLGLLTRSAAGASAERERSTPVPDAPRVESQRDGARRIHLALHGDALDAADLHQALSEELGREIVLGPPTADSVPEGTLTVAYTAARNELVVSWQRGGQTVTRVIATSSERVVEDAVLLAGNLIHSQIEDLVPPDAAEEPPPAPQASITFDPLTSGPPAATVVHSKPAAVSRRIATAGLFYPAASNYDEPEAATYVDINLMHGRVGSVHGVQLGGVNVVVRSGEAGRIEAPASAAADVAGVQLGYLGNVVAGRVTGVQLAGLFNHASGPVGAWQVAGAANFAGASLTGLQSAFLFNSAQRLSGVQAGLVNLSGDIDGVQVGLVNVAQKVRGVSIGLVNIADDIEGVPIAPFSVTRTGGVHPMIWSGTSGLANVGLKLSTRSTYTMLIASYHRAFERQFFGGGFGIGARIALDESFYSDIDVSGTYLIAPEQSFDAEYNANYHERLLQPRLRAILAYRHTHHFGLFIGVATTGQVRLELGTDRVTASVAPEVFGGIEL